MPTPTKGPRLGGGPAHERMILANLATQLFDKGRITTTEAKAKRLRPFAERLITFAKRGDLAARRRVLMTIRDKGVVHTLFTEIGPRFSERDGGYTRITKLPPRKGDNAPMAVIEVLDEPVPPKKQVVKEATKAAEVAAKKAPAAPVVEQAPAAEEAQVADVTTEAEGATSEQVAEAAVEAPVEGSEESAEETASSEETKSE